MMKTGSRVRGIVSGCVFWAGMALAGAVAALTGILFGILCLIVRAMNFLTGRIEKDV